MEMGRLFGGHSVRRGFQQEILRRDRRQQHVGRIDESPQQRSGKTSKYQWKGTPGCISLRVPFPSTRLLRDDCFQGVRSRMQRVCKCHGVSGSCSMQICWRKLPTFKSVGEGLFQRYEGATHVRLVQKRKKKLRNINPDFKKPNRTELVYLDESPDYCDKNETLVPFTVLHN